MGRYPEEAPLLFIIHRDRVKGRLVAELGVHSVVVESGRARLVEVVIVEIRTAVPTARQSDFNMIIYKKQRYYKSNVCTTDAMRHK